MTLSSITIDHIWEQSSATSKKMAEVSAAFLRESKVPLPKQHGF
jgi:hypothetical protein